MTLNEADRIRLRHMVESAEYALQFSAGRWVELEVASAVKSGVISAARIQGFLYDPKLAKLPLSQWDTAALLKLMRELWSDVFRHALGHAERSLVSEPSDFRNKWAHRQTFSGDAGQCEMPPVPTNAIRSDTLSQARRSAAPKAQARASSVSGGPWQLMLTGTSAKS